ncbi:MAG: hypothetical protein ACREB6_01930, partial [Rhodospirillales bacterium]
MPTTAIEVVPPPAPSADPLVAIERELTELVLEHQALREAWPKAPGAVERAAIGRQVEDAAQRISDLRLAIIGMPARTIAGASVQLRRLAAMLDRTEPGKRLAASDLNAARALL